jgi:hypothetical protein
MIAGVLSRTIELPNMVDVASGTCLPHAERAEQCQLTGENRPTYLIVRFSHFDPQLPIDSEFCCGAQRTP